MAILHKQIFGNIKGTFGSAVFKQRNGSNYISQRPSSYNPPNDESYFSRIEKFRLASKLSTMTITNPDLKSIWSNVAPKGQNVYNLLISKYYPFIDNTSVNPKLSLVPPTNVGIKLDTAVWTTDKLTLNLLPLASAANININVEKTAVFQALLILTQPVDSNSAIYEVVNISSNSLNLNLDDPLVFEFSFSTNIQNLISGYQKKAVFSTMLTYSEDNSLINYSSTVFTES